MEERQRAGRLLPIHTDAKMGHHQQDAGDDGEQPGDPERDGKPEEKIQTEDEQEERKEEIRHGIEVEDLFSHHGTLHAPSRTRYGVL
jgi:hypothetical protein